MIDSRSKGQRGEYAVRDILRTKTGFQWERIPASGALSYLKGDLFIPDHNCSFLVEVKNYEDSPFNDKIFTNKNNYIIAWWTKALEQAGYKSQKPLVIFKYNRSKLFVITDIKPVNTNKYMYIAWLECYALLLEEWLDSEEITWLKPSKA
jgi:Holliday junction resolvase